MATIEPTEEALTDDSLTSIAGTDVPGDTSSDVSIATGDVIEGEIDTVGDADWYRIEVTAGTMYRFQLNGSDSGSGTLPDPYLRLLDASGTELASNDDSLNLDSELAYTFDFDGTAFVSAEGLGGSVGTYQLTALALVDEAPGDTSSTVELAPDSPVDGELQISDDQDWYRVEVHAGASYVIDLRGADSGNGTLADPYLRLLDASGAELAANDDWNSLDSRIVYSFSEDGIAFVSAEGLGSSFGSYRLAIQEFVDDIPSGTNTTAVLAVGGSATGTIDFAGDGYSDLDWFRVEVEAGRTYLFDLEGVATGAGSLADPALALLDGSGNVLRYDDDGGAGSNARLGFTATDDGVVFLEASGLSTGTYRVSAMELAGDQPDSDATTAVLGIGAAATGSIDFLGDEDWYRVTVVAGKTYKVDVEGLATLQGTLADPGVVVSSLDGIWLSENLNGGSGGNAQAGFTATEDGEVLVHVRGDGGSTGSYSVVAVEIADDIGEAAEGAADLAIGSHLRSRIDFANDFDAFRIEVEAGKTYVFDLKGAAGGSGSLGQAFLVLRDTDGNWLAEDQGSGIGTNARIVYTAEADGDLLLTARGWGEDDQGSYAIRAAEDLGGRLTDLPRLHVGKALPDVAIQAQSLLQTGETADLQLTYLGGRPPHDSAIGIFTIGDQGQMQDLHVLAPSVRNLAAGTGFDLGTIRGDFGVVVIPRAADLIAGLADLATGELILRNPDTGDIARFWDDVAPQLVRVDGDRPTLVDAQVLFAHDNDPGSLENPLNPGGWVQATGGRVWRTDGSTDFRVLAFETGEARSGRASSDYDDLVLAIGDGPLSAADLAWTQHYLFA